MARTRVAIIGASGYTGVELVRLLVAHPHADLSLVSAQRRAGERLDEVFPSLKGRADQTLELFDADTVAQRAEVAFVALPHGESASCVDALCARGLKVIDLSADFRLHDLEEYERWYGKHPAAARLSQAVYGLPEIHREELRRAALVASPGCYPTASILALAPLLQAGLVSPDGIVIDAKSGVSGAGRNPSARTHFAETAEGIRAYGVVSHRHTPEIEQELGLLAKCAVKCTFTPHLVPMNRGILATAYAMPAHRVTAESIQMTLASAYRTEPFVVVTSTPPDTSHVRGSNRAHVAAWLDERAGRVIAMCAIDNLVKGASGQAIQSWNLMMGFAEAEGLESLALFP